MPASAYPASLTDFQPRQPDRRVLCRDQRRTGQARPTQTVVASASCGGSRYGSTKPFCRSTQQIDKTHGHQQVGDKGQPEVGEENSKPSLPSKGEG